MAYQRGSSSRSQTAANVGDAMLDSELVPSSLAEIVQILRAAIEVETINPKVAYICRFYAYEKANRLYPNSTGRGVCQFKTALLQRLEKENKNTLAAKQKSDARLMQKICDQYHKKHILQGSAPDGRAHLQTALVLFEVLKAVNLTESVVVADEIQASVAALRAVLEFCHGPKTTRRK